MKVMAFNGSPRKNWNTATLLNKTLEGAASLGAETELIHLYDLNYKGCMSCFACKVKNGKSYGRCAMNDDLAPVFKKIEQADAIVLGSPIYFGSLSGEMVAFKERLLFQYLTYTEPVQTLFSRKIRSGLVYTMNLSEKQAEERGYAQYLVANQMALALIFGSSESLFCFDTYQFNDYSKVVATKFDAEAKAQRHKDIFPEDCAKAFEMGVRLAKPATE